MSYRSRGSLAASRRHNLSLRSLDVKKLYEEYKTTMAGGGELRSGRGAEHDRKMVSEKYVFTLFRYAQP